MHPQGMTGLDLRPNKVKGEPVFLLVDFGPEGTITSPQIVKTLTAIQAQAFLNRMNEHAGEILANAVAEMVNDG